MIKIVKVNKLYLNSLLVSIVKRVSRSGRMKYQYENTDESNKKWLLGKKCVGCCWGRMSSNWRLPTATGVYFSIFDRPTRKSIFLQPRVLERVSWSYQQSKEFFSEAWVFFQARTIWEALLWERRAIYSECRVKSEMANYVNFARRMRLPALYFQLGDHIPTMAG